MLSHPLLALQDSSKLKLSRLHRSLARSPNVLSCSHASLLLAQVPMQYFPSAPIPVLMLMDHVTNPGCWLAAVLMEQDCCCFGFDLHSPILLFGA